MLDLIRYLDDPLHGTATWGYTTDVRLILTDADRPGPGVGVPTAGTPQPFGFTGELHSAGQVYLRARWYAPGQGRFVSVDPFAGFPERPYSLHAYQYGYSNPVRWTDPSGMHPTDPTPAELVFVAARIQKLYTERSPDIYKAEYSIPGVQDAAGAKTGYADLVNLRTGAMYEIKYQGHSDFDSAKQQLDAYIDAQKRRGLNPDEPGATWHAGRTFLRGGKMTRYDLGLWPVGLDPSYIPTHTGEVYTIKAWLDWHRAGLILFTADQEDTDTRDTRRDYDWRDIDRYIRDTFPAWRHNREDYEKGKARGNLQDLPPDLPPAPTPLSPWERLQLRFSCPA